MVKAGVAGATGYTGIELVQLIHRHPAVEILSLIHISEPTRPY